MAGVCIEDRINSFDRGAGLFCFEVIKKLQTEGTIEC